MALILVVDDRAINRQYLAFLLSSVGHTVIEADDGAEALELTRLRRPQLIISDVIMPNMDGVEMAQMIGTDPSISATPIILYTAAYHRADLTELSDRLPVAAVLAKPSEPQQILDAVASVLGSPATVDPAIASIYMEPVGVPEAWRSERLSTRLSDLQEFRVNAARQLNELQSNAASLDQDPLIDSINRALAASESLNLRLSALVEFSLELITHFDPLHILHTSCWAAQSIVGARYAAIGILNSAGTGLQHLFVRGMGDAWREVFAKMNPRAAALGAALTQGRPQILSGHPLPASVSGLPADHPAISSMLVIPILVKEAMPIDVRAIGWLYLADRVGDTEFDDEDARLGTMLAAQFSASRESQLLYERLQARTSDLAREIVERVQAQEKLARSLNAQQLLAACGRVQTHAKSEDLLLADVCATLVAHRCCVTASVVMVARRSALAVRARAGETTLPDRDLVKMVTSALARPAERRASGEILQPDRHWKKRLVELGLHSVLLIPLRHGIDRLGVIVIADSSARVPDDVQHATYVELAREIADSVLRLRERGAREQADLALRASEDKLSALMSSIDNVVYSMTGNQIFYINPVITRISGYSQQTFLEEAGFWRGIVHPDDRLMVTRNLANLIEEGSLTQEYRIVRADGQVRWLEDRVRVVFDDSGRVQRIDGVAADITQRKAHAAETEYLATHDSMTGLPNRKLLDDRATQVLAHASRSHQRVAVLYLDLDGFKNINDSFGHAVGDALLAGLAARLLALVRDTDTVARQGGDEFIILLCELDSVDAAVSVARKIAESVCEPIEISGQEFRVNCSIGISVAPDDGNDIHSLLTNADTAMYRGKAEGGNNIRFYSREMGDRARARMRIESDLRRAFERRELTLAYQPKFSLKNGMLIGAEALLRWYDPDGREIPCSSFIPVAEQTGLIVKIGAWTIERACRQLHDWLERGFSAVPLAVNLSGRQFLHNALPLSVSNALKAQQIDARYLELEITESMAMQDSDQVVDQLKKLKELGVAISVDDFGTGYSSLAYLKRLPLDGLKIDQSFVRDIATDEKDAAIVKAIISLSHHLGLKVIAEGVETVGQRDFLVENNCDEAQGFLYSPAVSSEAFEAFLSCGAGRWGGVNRSIDSQSMT